MKSKIDEYVAARKDEMRLYKELHTEVMNTARYMLDSLGDKHELLGFPRYPASVELLGFEIDDNYVSIEWCYALGDTFNDEFYFPVSMLYDQEMLSEWCDNPVSWGLSLIKGTIFQYEK